MRTVTLLLKTDALKVFCFAYFHSVMSYGVIFWGNLTDSKRVFNIQNKIIRIMADVKNRVSCRELFKKFNILPLGSELLPLLLLFVVDNTEKFQSNSDIHNINTRHKHGQSRGCSGSMMSDYGLDDRAIEVRSPTGRGFFF
jgi:hypothetical protein